MGDGTIGGTAAELQGKAELHSTSSQTRADSEVRDRVSDPARSDETGHDWTGEGGATPSGPATDTDQGSPSDQ
jgi:hypothetical protein